MQQMQQQQAAQQQYYAQQRVHQQLRQKTTWHSCNLDRQKDAISKTQSILANLDEHIERFSFKLSKYKSRLPGDCPATLQACGDTLEAFGKDLNSFAPQFGGRFEELYKAMKERVVDAEKKPPKR